MITHKREKQHYAVHNPDFWTVRDMSSALIYVLSVLRLRNYLTYVITYVVTVQYACIVPPPGCHWSRSPLRDDNILVKWHDAILQDVTPVGPRHIH
jgi:hypothetical protein